MKNKIIVSSILTIALCLSMIAGSTFALFTSESKVDIAVTSGTLDVDAVINNDLKLTSLGVEQTDAFANGGTATLTAEKLTLTNVTPGDSASFSITVTNNSNVAMNYRFVWSVEGELAQYLTATVDGDALVNNSTPYTLWTGDKTQTFNVVVTLPQGIGNEAQGKTADISFKVEAVQGNVDVLDNITYHTDENGNKVITGSLGELPEKVSILEGTVALRNKWLQGNTTVKEVVVPAGLSDFGGTPNADGKGASGGFFYKSAVEKVTLPEGLTEIPAAAFNGASNLKEVNIPASVTTVGINSFAYTGLETLTVPATITEIGYGAFRGMANLETVVIETSANIPGYAFRSCPNLKTVIITSEDITFSSGSMIFTNKDTGDGTAITVYVPTQEVADRLYEADSAAKTYGGYTIVVGNDPRVENADELVENLESGNDVILTGDVKIDPAGMSNAYGTTGINVKNGQTIDGNGNTLDVAGAGGTWDSGISTTGGTIKNITITGSFRGVFINHNSTHSEKVVLENVIIDGTVYTISCDQGNYQGLEATNCTFNGWTSYAETLGTAKFVNCNFGEGRGYAFCRPYAETVFEGCNFEEGYQVQAVASATFVNCYYNGVLVTAENIAELGLIYGSMDNVHINNN